jgi:hypothetical protein
MLKYTYGYAYLKLPAATETHSEECQEQDLTISLSLFLDHQERLERVTEQLRFLSENALTRIDRQRVVDMVSSHTLSALPRFVLGT